MARAGSRAALYFAVQAAAVAAWWAWLVLLPSSRPIFFAREVGNVTLLAFAVADGLVLVLGSLAVAGLAHRSSPHARAVAFAVLGALLYGTVWCVAAFFATGEAFLAVVAMAAASAATALAAVRLPGGAR